MTESLTLALRVGFSLMVVLGLMWVAARLLRGRLTSRGAGTLEVLARAQVGRGASVALVRVADRALVVGVTEHGISLLGEPITDLSSLSASTPDAAVSPDGEAPGLFASRRVEPGSSASAAAAAAGPLGGSLLSPSTWRQVVQVIRERTVRRG
jgi:flagellar protein FliO/FliZ